MSVPGLEPLLIFHLVAQTGSFAAAARRRGVTAQAIGQAIAGFEAQIGARLFHRTTRRLSLTEDGLLLRARTEAALAQIDDAFEAVAARKQEMAGRVRVAAPLALGRAIIAPIVFDLMAAHPDLAIDLVLDDHDTDLVAGRIDIAFRAGSMRAGGMVGRKLADVRLLLCAAPDYLARVGAIASLDDLARVDCVNFVAHAGDETWPFEFEIDGEAREISVHGRFATTDGEMGAIAAARGYGVAQLPNFIAAPYLRRRELEQVLPELALQRYGVWAYALSRRGRPARVTATLDHLSPRIAAHQDFV